MARACHIAVPINDHCSLSDRSTHTYIYVHSYAHTHTYTHTAMSSMTAETISDTKHMLIQEPLVRLNQSLQTADSWAGNLRSLSFSIRIHLSPEGTEEWVDPGLSAGCQNTTTHIAQRTTTVQFPELLGTAATLGSQEVTKAGVSMENLPPRWEMSKEQ